MCKYYRWNISFALKLLTLSLVLIVSGIFLILLRAAKLLFLCIFMYILCPTYKTRVHIFSDLKLALLLIAIVWCDILKNNITINQLPQNNLAHLLINQIIIPTMTGVDSSPYFKWLYPRKSSPYPQAIAPHVCMPIMSQ